VFGGALDAGRGLTNLAKPRRDDLSKPPPSREDPVGYNQARDEWAVRLGVDPYTTNRELALKLNHLALISFSTNKVTGAGVGCGMDALGPSAQEGFAARGWRVVQHSQTRGSSGEISLYAATNARPGGSPAS